MSSRYPLRNAQPGKSVRRLSPTAIRNTGPLKRPGKAEEREPNLAPPETGPGPSTGTSASASYAAMPTEMDVDAAEPRAGVKIEPARDDGSEEPSLSSCLEDDDERQYVPTVETDTVDHSNNQTQVPDTQSASNEGLDEQLIRDVNEALSGMTPAEREQVDKRMGNLSNPNTADDPITKGKSIDPRNWGDIELDEAEINPVIQQEIIKESNDAHRRGTQPSIPIRDVNVAIADAEANNANVNASGDKTVEITDQYEPSRQDVIDYLRNKNKLTKEMDRMRKKQLSSHKKRVGRAASEPISDELAALIQKVAEGSKTKHKYKPTNGGKPHRSDKEAATKPITQITAQSALGRAFGRLNKKRRREPSESEPSSSDSSYDDESEPESSSSYSSEEEDSSSTSDSESESSRHRRGRARSRRSKRKHSRRAIIKPTPPDKYDGRVDIRAFHKFLTHGTAYVKYGYVERQRQVMVLSEFLTGKAYTFYTRSVSLDPERWSLRKFFVEMFNYCFPIDFRNQQREKLNSFAQGQKSVREYVADLDELFTIVGADSSRARVVKLFNGFRPAIRKALLREHMNPEYTSWKAMVKEAEYQELAENVDLKENVNHNSHHRSGGQTHNSGEHQGSKEENNKSGRTNHSSNRSRNFRSAVGRKTNTTPNLSSQRTKGKGSQYNKAQPEKRNSDQTGPSLTKEERDELRAANKCFVCGEEGHFARNCRHKGKARSGNGKPPGISAFGVRLNLDRTEKLRVASLGETTALTVGMIGWDNHEHVKEYDSDGDTIPDLQSVSDSGSEHEICEESGRNATSALIDALWGSGSSDSANKSLTEEIMVAPPEQFRSNFWTTVEDADDRVTLMDTYDPHERVGDAICNKLTEFLERMQPYPGDPANVLQFRPRRFVAASVPCSDEILLYDRVTERYETLPKSTVTRNTFPVGDWYAKIRQEDTGAPYNRRGFYQECLCTDVYTWNARRTLEMGAPYPWDERDRVHRYQRFEVIPDGSVCGIYDRHLGFKTKIELYHLRNEQFNLAGWYIKKVRKSFDKLAAEAYTPPYDPNYFVACLFEEDLTQENDSHKYELDLIRTWVSAFGRLRLEVEDERLHVIGLNGQQIKAGTYPSIQRNSAFAKDPSRQVPKPLVVVVNINGHPARALIDSGSLGDFISSTLVQQLGINKRELTSPVPVQLAVQGSRSRINYGATATFKYQSISEDRYFDVINLSSYDLILGTPFLFQHRVTFGINPSRVVIGSSKSTPMQGTGVTQLASRSMEMYEEDLEVVREELRRYAAPICKSASDTPLPPLRAINHEIDLIDPNRTYPWRPSRCPEAMRTQWTEKRDAYIRNGRWKVTSNGNTVPMMLIPKPIKHGEAPRLRTVFDLRARNANTVKRSSPLPDIDGILRRAAKGRYRSILDGKDAYEQIRVIPEHVERTAVTTPDGNMVSNVIQQGDCNAPATYQALMNHIFSAYIGRFMDVYLDDIIVYSETLDDHIKHVKCIVDILRREKLYLGENKLQFLCCEMKVLGRVVSDEGIRMDPDKVDALSKWKTPTNRDLLRGFLGAAGYLADDIDRVRIPMGILHTLTGDTVPFRWDHTHQRAFEDIKISAVKCRDHHRRPLDYGPDRKPINVVTDGCVTGIAGVVSQGDDWRNATVAAFYSAKLNSAQQNYPVHEVEMLAGVETMLRHRDILQGVKFTWYTDHKGLVHLLNQKNLSGRQARWLEKISEFDFDVVYVPGADNILSDALSRLYSNDEAGTVRARSEYTYHDVIDNDSLSTHLISMPVLVGQEGESENLVLEGHGHKAEIVTADDGLNSRAQGGEPDCHPDQAQTKATTSGVMPKRAYRRREVEPAETGRAETAREFAARTSKSFVLKGPQQRKEGENGTQQRLTIKIPARKRNDTIPAAKNKSADEIIDEIEITEHDLEQAREKQISEQSIKLQQLVEPMNPVSLSEMMAGGREPIDLLESIRDKYGDDPTWAPIIENPREYKNFEITEDKLLYLKTNENKVLCIPSIIVAGRSIREIIISEAHSMLAHLGARKTLTYLREHVWWKTISSDVHSWCESCVICARSKPSNHKPYGKLNPLPVPTQPWEVIGIDFVGPLPESKDRDATYNSLTVIIDHLTSMIHLVPSRTNYNARNIAELVFAEVYKLHGLPKAIVSDRDSYFTSLFWTHLHTLIGTQLKMSSAYHPETDGATERANRTITQMIRQCISPNQSDWAAKLPAIEFAINTARSESTGYSPFFLNYGRLPRTMIWDSAPKTEYPGVRVFAQRLKSAMMAAHDCILNARVKQTRKANRKRAVVPFKEGEFVYVSTVNMAFPKGLARKLIPKFVGPYLLLKDYGNHSFRVQLPSHMKQRGIHDVFHASLMRIHHPNDDRRFPGRLYSQIIHETEPDHESEWAADKILGHAGSKTNAIFEVLWRAGDKTWLPLDQVRDLDLLQPYLDAQGVDSIEELPGGTGIPPVDDPQVFLGSQSLENIFKPSNRLHGIQQPAHLESVEPSLRIHSIPSSHILTSSIHLSAMSFRPKNHYIPHPCLAARPDGFVQLTAVEPNLIIHPAQLLKFVDHDADVRRRSATVDLIEPAGYETFAKIYNASKGDNPCLFILRDPKTLLYDYDSFPIPRSLLTFPIIDNRYSEFRSFGIINAQGDINVDAWASLKNALLRPHREAVRNQARSDSRRAERETKRRRAEEARPDGFIMPVASSSNTTANKKRGRKAKSSSDTSETRDDANMELEDFPDN